jgi:hypothetical protein
MWLREEMGTMLHLLQIKSCRVEEWLVAFSVLVE